MDVVASRRSSGGRGGELSIMEAAGITGRLSGLHLAKLHLKSGFLGCFSSASAVYCHVQSDLSKETKYRL